MSDIFFAAASAGTTATASTTAPVGTAGSAAGGYQNSSMWVYGALMLGFLFVYWFLILKPHNKKRKEMQDKLGKLAKGDKVVTIGGLHGKVVAVKDTVVVLKVDENTEVTFDKNAINTVLTKKNEAELEKAAIVNNKEKAEKEDEEK